MIEDPVPIKQGIHFLYYVIVSHPVSVHIPPHHCSNFLFHRHVPLPDEVHSKFFLHMPYPLYHKIPAIVHNQYDSRYCCSDIQYNYLLDLSFHFYCPVSLIIHEKHLRRAQVQGIVHFPSSCAAAPDHLHNPLYLSVLVTFLPHP